MPIENIYQRIISEAEEKAAAIIESARTEAQRTTKEYSRKAEELRSELGAYAERKARDEERHLIVNEQLEQRKRILSKKREILEEVYSEAKERILALPAEECRKILSNMILEKAVTGNEEIIVSSSQADLFSQSFLKSLCDGFTGKGKFSLSGEKGDFEWGVVLREGRRVVDLSLDVIFEQLKEKIEPRIAVILFPEE